MSMARARGKQTLLLLAAGILAAAGCDEKHPEPVRTPPASVEVAFPVVREVTDYQIFTARTQAVDSVDLKARVTGYLRTINFKEGDEIKEGDLLFQIDDRSYKSTLDQAKANLLVSKATLDQAIAAEEVAKAALIKAQADYDIGLNVQKQNPGAISDQEITRRLGARDEAKGNIDKAKAAIAEAKSGIEQAKAALEKAQLYYDWCKVTAPITGRINQRFVSVGNLVSQDTTTLTNIVSLKPIWAYFDVDQNTALHVQKLIQEGKIRSVRTSEIPVQMGLGGGHDFPIAGVIDFISNQLDPNTGSIRVRAVFPNADGTLAAGLFTRIRVPLSASHPALLVSDRAVGTDQGQKFVLVVNEKNEVEYRAVDVGQVHDGLREVFRFRTITETGAGGKEVRRHVEMLKMTDRLIVNGLQRVRPGASVEPKLVDMATLLVRSP